MYHFYSKTGKNRVSFAGRHENGLLEVAVARTSSKDTFVRKKGRAITEGRLRAGKVFLRKPMENCSPKDFINAISPYVEAIEQTPSMVNDQLSSNLIDIS